MPYPDRSPEGFGHDLHRKAAVLLKVWLIEQFVRRSFVQEVRENPGYLTDIAAHYLTESFGLTLADLEVLLYCDVRSTIAYIIGAFEGTGDLLRSYRAIQAAEAAEQP